ncbi:MAG: bL35 family ribosomal protein [Candidatus Hodgkinia cicadicola]
MIHKLKPHKLKTKSALKKRLKITRSGKIKAYCGYRRHRLYRKSKSSKQRLRSFFVAKSDIVAVKRLMCC